MSESEDSYEYIIEAIYQNKEKETCGFNDFSDVQSFVLEVLYENPYETYSSQIKIKLTEEDKITEFSTNSVRR